MSRNDGVKEKILSLQEDGTVEIAKLKTQKSAKSLIYPSS